MTDYHEYIRQQLHSFNANSTEPCWSSYRIEQLFQSVTSEGGSVGDVLESLYPLLNHPHLSQVLADFIKTLAIQAFSGYQESYQNSNLRWMSDAVRGECAAPQAYLALYSLPPKLLDASCILSIFKALASTSFWSEAVANLEGEVDGVEAQELLNEWLSSGIQPHCRSDVERMANISRK